MNSLVGANSSFGLDLFQSFLKDQPKGNIIYSPFSVSTALAMVYYGAQNKTAKQMEKVLHFNQITETGASTNPDSSGGIQPRSQSQCDRPGGIHSQFKQLLAAINQHTSKYELSIANRLYGDQRYKFHQHYLDCLKELYHASLESTDFQNAAEEARKKINSWVESQTKGKIKDLFPTGAIASNTALAIVNAIYFKGNWKMPFDKKNTQEAPFFTDKKQSKTVQMMFQEGTFNLATISKPQIQVLELLYDQDELSMLILLPDSEEGIDQLEKELTSAKLEGWTSAANMKKQKVDVYLPKFKLEEKYDLSKVLQALGMTDVFENADLSGISDDNLNVSEVFHKAYVEVNEEGTEAAAATGVTVVRSSLNPVFRVDHPFFFSIKHNKTNSLLFLGKVSSP